MKKALVSLGLAGLLFFTPAIPIYAQYSPAEQTTLEYKIEKTFPNKQIKDIEDFRQYADDLMEIVAEQMNLKLDERIPKPKIITQEDMNLDGFNRRYAEWCKERGFAPSYLSAMFPRYFEKENEILLLEDSKLHTLAHEFVHYFQVRYKHADPKLDVCDFLEGEAITIQHWFKDKYLK